MQTHDTIDATPPLAAAATSASTDSPGHTERRAEATPASHGSREHQVKPARPSASSRLVELALGAGVKLFHTSDQVPYVQVPFEDHVEVHAVLGLSFRRFLRHLFYEAEERAVGGEALNAALATLEARAVFEGPEHPVYRRVAPNSGGGVVLDLEAVMHLSAVMAIS